MAPLRLGVVGLGAISGFYLAAIDVLSEVELAAVCDVRPAALGPHRGRVRCYDDHRAMLADGLLDAVLITVPNDLHAEVCRDALVAGLPVCVEKPLAISVAQGRALHRLAGLRGLPLFTAFHRRYNEHLRSLLSDIAAAAPVQTVRVRYLERIEEHIGPDTWYLDPRRCGGGCVADNGPNAFDLVRLLIGEVEVTSAEICRDRRGIDRLAVIELRGAGETAATVRLDWSHPGETKDVTVSLVDGSTLRADLLRGHPVFKGSLWHEYTGVLSDFARVVAAGTPAVARAGLAAVELVDACYRLDHAVRPSRAMERQ